MGSVDMTLCRRVATDSSNCLRWASGMRSRNWNLIVEWAGGQSSLAAMAMSESMFLSAA